jgi:hypothetical protein
MTADAGPVSEEQQLADFERIWNGVQPSLGNEHSDLLEMARGTCRNALICCSTLEQQRSWLQRYLSVDAGALVSPAVRLQGQKATGGACRSCRKSAAVIKDEGGKLRICAGCSGVGYCSTACQQTDWPRHRVSCKSAARLAKRDDAGANAALSEARCCECLLTLSADLVTVLKCGHPLHRACYERLADEVMLLAERVAARCPVCDIPFRAPLAPRTWGSDMRGPPDVICESLEEVQGQGQEFSIDDVAASEISRKMWPGISHQERAARLRSMGVVGMILPGPRA